MWWIWQEITLLKKTELSLMCRPSDYRSRQCDCHREERTTKTWGATKKKNPKTFNQTQQLRHISVYSLCRSLPLSLSQAFCSIDLSRKRKDEPCFGSHLEHLKNHLAHHSLQPESIRAAAEDLLLQPSRHHIMEAAWVPKHRGPQ